MELDPQNIKGLVGVRRLKLELHTGVAPKAP